MLSSKHDAGPVASAFFCTALTWGPEGLHRGNVTPVQSYQMSKKLMKGLQNLGLFALNLYYSRPPNYLALSLITDKHKGGHVSTRAGSDFTELRNVVADS